MFSEWLTLKTLCLRYFVLRLQPCSSSLRARIIEYKRRVRLIFLRLSPAFSRCICHVCCCAHPPDGDVRVTGGVASAARTGLAAGGEVFLAA